MLLAIDTSTRLVGLACYDESGVLGECAWQSGNNQTAQLLPQLDLLLRHLGKDQGALRALAVALGPGSWSGLRVGVSVAKGLALARGLPLVGVGTLDALAYQHQRPATPVFPLIHLGRDRYATAEFQHRGQWKRLSDYRNVSLAELCGDIQDRALFCGDIGPEVQAQLRRGLGERARFPHPAANMRRPGYLAELAWHRLGEAAPDDVAALEPIYLGNPVQPK
jgi:tRNA threonylcarbamoyladenosine biosynthesis protein TsaB